jgi:hypothetical protein
MNDWQLHQFASGQPLTEAEKPKRSFEDAIRDAENAPAERRWNSQMRRYWNRRFTPRDLERSKQIGQDK